MILSYTSYGNLVKENGGEVWKPTGILKEEFFNSKLKMGALENQQRAQESFSQICVY